MADICFINLELINLFFYLKCYYQGEASTQQLKTYSIN